MQNDNNVNFVSIDGLPTTQRVYYKRVDTAGGSNSRFGVVTASFLIFLTMSILQSGDVEANPGPLQNWFPPTAMSNDQKLDKILCMNMNFEHRFQALEQHLSSSCQQIFQQLQCMEGAVRQNSSKLLEVVDRQDNLQDRLVRLEEAAERHEQQSRRNNLLFHGVREEPGEAHRIRSIVLKMLSHHFPFTKWQDVDIEEVHRIGARSSSRTRPLLVRFYRQSDVQEILRDHEGRGAMRTEEGVRVSSDLTKQQRDNIAEYKEQGKRAYYKNGRLVVQDEYTRRQYGRHGNEWQSSQRHNYRYRAQYDGEYDGGRRTMQPMQRSTDDGHSGVSDQRVTEPHPLPMSLPSRITQLLTNDNPPRSSLSPPRHVISQAAEVTHSQASTGDDMAVAAWGASYGGGGGDWDTTVSQQMADYDASVDNDDDDFPTSAQPSVPGGVQKDAPTPPTSAGKLRGFGRGSPLQTPDENAVQSPSHVAAGRSRRLSGRGGGGQSSMRLTRSMSLVKGQSKLPGSWTKARGGADGDHQAETTAVTVTATLPAAANSSQSADEAD
jgi:hypothetical protein